ncbi:MAG: hypothetical protein AAGA34_00050 [Pseudomonadota bacterium]
MITDALIAAALAVLPLPPSANETDKNAAPADGPSAIFAELVTLGFEVCPAIERAQGDKGWTRKLEQLGYDFESTTGGMVLLARPDAPGAIALHVGPASGWRPDGKPLKAKACVISFGGVERFADTIAALKSELTARGYVDYTPGAAIQQNSRFARQTEGGYQTFQIFEMDNASNAHLPLPTSSRTAFLTVVS